MSKSQICDVLGREAATLVDKFKQPCIYNSQFFILNYPVEYISTA
ncbi:MAG: hypothetical protein AB1394_09345 [Bacteroidota bacterium]